MGDGTLKSVFFIALMLLLLPMVSAKSEGGVNVDPVLEETIFSEISHTGVTTDFEIWEINFTLGQAAFENNTSFTLTTQICNNEGVCLPPENQPLSTIDNRSFMGNVTTIDDHTYVNWRVKANYTDDNNTKESFPPSGFYKTWSDCWFFENEWGGDGCVIPVKTTQNNDSLPAITGLITLSVITIAAIIRRQ